MKDGDSRGRADAKRFARPISRRGPLSPSRYGMAAGRLHIIKAVVRHLFATVQECVRGVINQGVVGSHTGGYDDQNPNGNVAVLLSGRFCHGDRDRGC